MDGEISKAEEEYKNGYDDCQSDDDMAQLAGEIANKYNLNWKWHPHWGWIGAVVFETK